MLSVWILVSISGQLYIVGLMFSVEAGMDDGIDIVPNGGTDDNDHSGVM